MNLFMLTLIVASLGQWANAQSTSSDVCSKKKTQYGANFISCSEVDWGVTPFSADYQPSNFGPMTAPPSIIKNAKNDYPGILNTEYYFGNSFYPTQPDLQGLPLASKFLSAFPKSTDPTEDQKFVKWSTDWYASLQPSSGSSGWEGKCKGWSAWSMDPELQRLFSGIRDGIICSGIPFTKGELKEIVTSLYPEPVTDSTLFTKFYQAYAFANPDTVEDANVALSKLGMLGRGDIGPAQVLKLAQDTRAAGKNMMMDRDPGTEIWNHPIKKITDIAYREAGLNQWTTLSSGELVAQTPENQAFLSDLKSVESELTQNLLSANGISSHRLCSLRKQVGEACDDLNGKIALAAQVDVVNRLKESASNKKMIGTQKPITLVKHEMIIEYGTENSFASNAPDQTIVQSYQYTAVNSTNQDGSSTLIRSQWSPSLASLGQICANTALAKGRNSTSMTRGFDPDQKCANRKPKDPTLADREYFTGAVPPNNFRTFVPKPGFTSAQTEQQKAYNKLLEFMATCDRFDAGVDFLKNLETASRDNVFSSAEQASLQNQYASVKKLLDPTYIQSLLGNKYQGVQGVEKLKFN